LLIFWATWHGFRTLFVPEELFSFESCLIEYKGWVALVKMGGKFWGTNALVNIATTIMLVHFSIKSFLLFGLCQFEVILEIEKQLIL
jgi:hypothetical protein